MNYEEAKKSDATYGVDTDGALAALDQIPISIHCWQGDDVLGFEDRSRGLSGGIQTTGNSPGRARTPAELMADFDEALTLIPGKKRLSLHASYAVFDGAPKADRDAIAPEHFRPWGEYARDSPFPARTGKSALFGCGTGSPAARSRPILRRSLARTAFATCGSRTG